MSVACRTAENARRTNPGDPSDAEHAGDPLVAAVRRRRISDRAIHRREARGEPQSLDAGRGLLAGRDGVLRHRPRREPGVLLPRHRRDGVRLQRTARARQTHRTQTNLRYVLITSSRFRLISSGATRIGVIRGGNVDYILLFFYI